MKKSILLALLLLTGCANAQEEIITNKEDTIIKSEYTELKEFKPIVIDDDYTPKTISLGEFLITGYCDCYECSEGWGRQTSTGAIATPNHTIAVDPNIIPYGSKVIIDGNIYVAEDCGGYINNKHIDIFCETHEECFSDFCNGWKEVLLIED